MGLLLDNLFVLFLAVFLYRHDIKTTCKAIHYYIGVAHSGSLLYHPSAHRK